MKALDGAGISAQANVRERRHVHVHRTDRGVGFRRADPNQRRRRPICVVAHFTGDVRACSIQSAARCKTTLADDVELPRRSHHRRALPDVRRGRRPIPISATPARAPTDRVRACRASSAASATARFGTAAGTSADCPPTAQTSVGTFDLNVRLDDRQRHVRDGREQPDVHVHSVQPRTNAGARINAR